MFNPKQIFTWWYRQTFGTFLKTLFFGKFVGKDEYGNKYYKNKKNDRWVIYSNNVEASKITLLIFFFELINIYEKLPVNENGRISLIFIVTISPG